MAGPAGNIPVEWVSASVADRRRIIIYLHGGAYLMGSPKSHRSITCYLAKHTGFRVMVPDYRLAPEAPAPAAVEDALSVYTHLLKQGYLPEEIAFAGESAGGGLCFALLLLALQKGFPAPGCVVAFSPWVDLTHSGDSTVANADCDCMLPAERIAEVAAFYIGEGRAADPLISPLLGDFTAPPPALITASKTEILRDDAIRLAHKLRDAGGEVQLHLTENTPHAVEFFAPILPEARASLNRASAFIKANLNFAEHKTLSESISAQNSKPDATP